LAPIIDESKPVGLTVDDPRVGNNARFFENCTYEENKSRNNSLETQREAKAC
jgi:hypothetical protein